MTCLLFVGSGGERAALEEADRVGRLVAYFGQDGLKAAEARKAVEVLLSCPAGTGTGVVILGPLDDAHPTAVDVLLKIVEEHHEDIVRPVLWARHTEGISPALLSRCTERYCPGEQEQIDETVYDILGAVSSGDLHLLPELMKPFVTSRDVSSLLDQLSRVLLSDPTDKNLRVWEVLRKVAQQRNPTYLGVLASLFEVS